MRTLIAIIVGAVTAYLLFPGIFKSKDDFIGCIKYCITPHYPFFKGRFGDDNNNWAEFKLLFWLLASLGMGYGAYSLL